MVSRFRSLTAVAVASALMAVAAAAPGDARADLSESFDPGAGPGAAWVPAGWTGTNRSQPLGVTSWFQGNPPSSVPDPGPFPAHQGVDASYVAANHNSTTGGSGTISNWLITPQITSLSDGDTLSFFTRTAAGATVYPDRLEVRVAAGGTCSPGTTAAGVGDFTTLVVSVNPSLTTSGYPTAWTRYDGTLRGLPAGVSTGCIAFRYFVTGAGPLGSNSDYIGIDTFSFVDDVTPPPAPSLSGLSPASPGNVAQPRATGTAEDYATIRIYGDASCSGPVLGTGTAAQLAAGGVAFDAAADATTTPYATATDGSDNVSPCSAAGPAYFHDATTPVTTDDVPAQWQTAPVEVRLTAGDGSGSGVVATYFTVGADPQEPTTSSAVYDDATPPQLGDGERIRYFSVDAAGNAESPRSSLVVVAPPRAPEPRTPEPRTPEQPRAPAPAPPLVTLTERPAALTSSRAVRIGFAVDPSAAAYECRLNDGRWEACRSPLDLTGLRAGDHRVEIRGIAADGRRGPVTVHLFQANPYPPGISLAAETLRATRAGTVAPRIGCSPREGEGRGRCIGSVRITYAATVKPRGGGRAARRVGTLAQAPVDLAAGATATPRLTLSAAARRALATAPGRRLSVRVVVEARDLAGNRTLISFARQLEGAGR